MTLHLFRRRAWIVPVALSLWSTGPAPAFSANGVRGADVASGAPSPEPTLAQGAESSTTRDAASPDAPAGPPAATVLQDFARPPLSVPATDWRKINADVSPSTATHGSRGAHAGAHSTHSAHSANNASAGALDHAAMGHATPIPPPAEATANAHAGHRGAHAGHDAAGGSQ